MFVNTLENKNSAEIVRTSRLQSERPVYWKKIRHRRLF